MTTDQPTASTSSSPRRRKWPRRLLLAGITLVLLLAILIALAPTIASSFAPGIIESSLNKSLNGGHAKVAKFRIGWSGPMIAGPIEIYDASNRLAARAEVTAPISVGKALSLAMNSSGDIDLGTIEASGLIDLIRTPDGQTNLEKLFAPKPGAPSASKPDTSSSSSKSSLPSKLALTLKLTQFDASIRDQAADGTLGPESGVKKLAGSADVQYAPSSGQISAKADFSGSPLWNGKPGDQPVKLTLDAQAKQNSAKTGASSIEDAKAKLTISNAPVAVIDALAAMGGALTQGIGDRLDIALDAAGNMTAGTAAINLKSDGLNGDINLALKDNLLTSSTTSPSQLALRSTDLLAKLPQTRDAITSAGNSVKLTQAPSISITIESLSLPVPKELASGGKADPATLDLRGGKLVARLNVSAVQGQVAIPNSAPSAPNAPAPAPTWKPFAVEPITLTLNIPDLAQPISISTGTKATLDGQPAGNLQLDLAAQGLLDSAGHLRAMGKNAGFADKADAAVRLTGVSTALIQPLVAGMNLPLEVQQDVGPTLDLALQAKADVSAGAQPAPGAQGLAALPPADLSFTLTSANMNAGAELKLDKSIATSTGKHIFITVNSASPLATRILAASNKPAPSAAPNASTTPAAKPMQIALTGAGKLELTIRDLVLPLTDSTGKSPADMPAHVLSTGRGSVNLALTDTNASIDMQGDTSPIRIDRFTLAMLLYPTKAPRVEINSALGHRNQPFTITGAIDAPGLKNGPPKSSGPAALSEVNPQGSFEIANLPRTILGIVPSLQAYASGTITPTGDAAADDQARQIAQAVQNALGQTINLKLQTQPAAAPAQGQAATLTLRTAADGVGADLRARFSPADVELTSTTFYLKADPAALNPLLSSMSPAAEPNTPAAPPMQLGAPVKFSIVVDKPARIPLAKDAAGALAPDWAKADPITARILTDGELVVKNVSLGSDTDAQGNPTAPRTTDVALRQLTGELLAPLAGLDPAQKDKQRIAFKAAATAVSRGGSAAAAEAPVLNFSADASASMSGAQPNATVTLTDVNTGVVENLINQPGMLVGMLGDTAGATLRVQPGATGSTDPKAMTIEAQLTAPRVEGGKIGLAMDSNRIWNTGPISIKINPALEWINNRLGADAPPAAQPGDGKAPAPQPKPRARRKNANTPTAQASEPTPEPLGVSMQQSQPITLNITKLSLATTQTGADGKATQGPLKPGIFDLDMSLSIPSIALNVPTSGANQAPATMTIQGLNTIIKSTGPGAITADMGIDSVSGAGAQSQKKSTVNLALTNLADASGIVNPDAATINADIDISAFPTPIVDKLANQHGLLNEVLGTTVTLVASAKNIKRLAEVDAPVGRGSLEATATSPRASAKIKGVIRKGRFVQGPEGTVDIRLSEIRPTLVQQLSGGLPLVTSLEKSPQDAPASITAKGLTVPLDNDLSRLNGTLTVDPGVARFTTQSIFGQLIKGLGGRESGTIGKRIEPFVVKINDGVATYQQFKLPMGEFNLETRGTIDLVKKEVNVVTYAPFFALSEEGLGKIRLGFPKIDIIDRNTLVPITTKGSLDNPKTELDFGLFMQETGDKLLKQPGKILEGIGDLLGGGKDKKKDK